MDTVVEEIANYRYVNDRLATAGQPTEAQLRAVAAAGYEVVINLAPHEDPRSLADEAALVHSLGLSYVNIPVPFASPDSDQLEAFFAAMQEAEQQGRRLFIHCLANKRVTAFLGLYAVLRKGQSEPAAFALMHDVWIPNEVWTAFIQAMLARHPRAR